MGTEVMAGGLKVEDLANQIVRMYVTLQVDFGVCISMILKCIGESCICRANGMDESHPSLATTC